MSDVQSPIPWEIAFIRSWQKLASTAVAALAVASAIWELGYRPFLYDFIFAPDVIAPGSVAARDALFPYVAVAAVVAVGLGVRTLLQARRGRSEWLLHRELFCTGLIALPLLSVPAIEFEHTLFTALLVVVFSLALGLIVSRETATWRRLPELSRRQAQVLVGLAYATFVGVIGFIAYWRYITFHAAVADLSAEVNAVAGILRHGIPTISVGAFFYDGKPLPSPYFNLHVPLADYLFAPFYAVYRHPSSIDIGGLGVVDVQNAVAVGHLLEPVGHAREGAQPTANIVGTDSPGQSGSGRCGQRSSGATICSLRWSKLCWRS